MTFRDLGSKSSHRTVLEVCTFLGFLVNEDCPAVARPQGDGRYSVGVECEVVGSVAQDALHRGGCGTVGHVNPQ